MVGVQDNDARCKGILGRDAYGAVDSIAAVANPHECIAVLCPNQASGAGSLFVDIVNHATRRIGVCEKVKVVKERRASVLLYQTIATAAGSKSVRRGFE